MIKRNRAQVNSNNFFFIRKFYKQKLNSLYFVNVYVNGPIEETSNTTHNAYVYKNIFGVMVELMILPLLFDTRICGH